MIWYADCARFRSSGRIATSFQLKRGARASMPRGLTRYSQRKSSTRRLPAAASPAAENPQERQ